MRWGEEITYTRCDSSLLRFLVVFLGLGWHFYCPIMIVLIFKCIYATPHSRNELNFYYEIFLFQNVCMHLCV